MVGQWPDLHAVDFLRLWMNGTLDRLVARLVFSWWLTLLWLAGRWRGQVPYFCTGSTVWGRTSRLPKSGFPQTRLIRRWVGAGVLTGVSLSTCENPLFLKWRFGCYLFSNFTAGRAVISHLSKGGFFLEWSQVHLEAKTCNTFSRY